MTARLTSSLLGTFPLSLAIAASAHAQPGGGGAPIDEVNRWSWQENCGWMDWGAAGSPAGSQAARVYTFIAGGFVWCENLGWLNLGDASPPSGFQYANVNGTDFGVNFVGGPNHEFGGFAWSENAGWVNFGPFPGLPFNQRARVENAYVNQEASDRLLGYAWSENLGWINLDNANLYVQFHRCDDIDFNNDGLFPDTQDITDLIEVFSGRACSTGAGNCNDIDFNNDGLYPDTWDIESFLYAFSGGGCA